VPLTNIHSSWQKDKMSSADAKAEILRSRAVGSEKMLRVIEFHEKARKDVETKNMSNHVLAKLKSKEKKFRQDVTVDVWAKQFVDVYTNPMYRYTCLLLRGESRAGKTAFAVSIFGFERTLVVNCQGCSPDLPSIEAFDFSRHVAIVWDEIDEQQVLHNKQVFQAPAHVVTLGQSKCNQFACAKLLHGVAMVLCSNTFAYPHTGCNTSLTPMDENWITSNIYEVQLPAGEVWYEETPEEARERKRMRPCLFDNKNTLEDWVGR